MKTFSMAVAATALAAAGADAARAADLSAPEAAVEASMFDVAFGVAGVSDYRFRGVTQTRKNPAIQGYVELQAFDWIYAGIWSSSVSFPTRFGLTDPAAEVDFYAGVRHTWGAFSLDVGYLYYWYPGETKAFPGQRQTDYWEIKALPSVAIGEYGSITGNLWWSADYANTGGNDLYLSLAPKINLPISSISDVAFYVSGELGKQWLGKNDFDFNPKDFWTWNVGGGMTYKAMTLDLRYSDTNLTRDECFGNTGARSWCGSTVMGKIAFDTSLNKLK
jgi:uncharacterized protein (TIGR02001 family)